MRYLSKYKMVRMGEEGKWKHCKKLAYIDNINSPTLQLVLFLMWHKVNVQFSMWVLPCRKHSRLYEKD